MSKYAQLRTLMGGTEVFNTCRRGGGRSLRWNSKSIGMSPSERREAANKLFKELRDAGLHYIQKVEIKNMATTSSRIVDGKLVFNTTKVCDRITIFVSRF